MLSSIRKWVAACFIFLTSITYADVNVLILGTQKDYGVSYGKGTAQAFDPAKVRTELDNILSGTGAGNVNVTFKELRSSYSSLLTFYHMDANNRSLLRGESGTDWDYVVILDEASTMEYFSGLYSEGVHAVIKDIKEGGAEPILLMPWPGQNSDATVNYYKELYHR